jgi:hypothetical protein
MNKLCQILCILKQKLYVEGLILLVPVGLNEIGSYTLTRNYITDFLIKSLPVIVREIAREPSLRKKIHSFFQNIPFAIGAFIEFFDSILKEMRESKRKYFSRWHNDLNEMTKKNPHLNQIKVPTILIQGTKDHVSDFERIITQAKHNSITDFEKDTISKETLSLCKNGRKQILIKNVFPQSSYVKVVEAEKFGTHILPLFRSKSVARVSLYLLKRSQ